uniref:Uncharacterized protein n=1 Tax=Parascaris univalens TaxID=6257 RepID=A0A915BI65_PARUN
MGSGASSNVKEITIDQNDNKWDQYKGRRGNSSSSAKRSANSFSKRFLKSTRSASAERKRNEEILSILATTERKLHDAEEKIKNLQRELCTFELRNNELLDETIWLKQQIGQPEIPLCVRPSNDLAKGITDAERCLHEQLEKFKYELEKQQKSYEDRIAQLSKEYDQKISFIQRELLNERMANEKLNAAIDKYRKAEDRKRINDALISTSSRPSSEVIATHFYTPPPSSQDDGETMTNYLSGNSKIVDCRKLSMEDKETINADDDVNTNIPSTSVPLSFQPKTTSYNDNRRTTSSTRRTRIGNNFENIYTLTESMEPIKVMETPRSADSVRPATADTTIADMRCKESQDASTILMRGSSAPMLFKSRSRAHRLQRSHGDKIQADDDDSPSMHIQQNRTNDEFPLSSER